MPRSEVKPRFPPRPALIVVLSVLAGTPVGTAFAADAGPGDMGRSYVDGLIAGEAQGREEGRTLEIGRNLPPGERDAVQAAFRAGYAAGANDAFGGYDGGWAMNVPYAVTLAPGAGPITYRIGNRVPFEPGIAYFLCADGHGLCQAARR